MNENIKEDTVLKSGSKYSRMPIEHNPPRYTASDILIIIFTFILFSIFISVFLYVIFGNKNKGFEPIDLHPNEKKNNNQAAQQNNLCETGPNEKCTSCNKKECGSCNLGYKLENGKCIPNYALKGTYQTSNKNEFIPIINDIYVPYISELIIDNQNISNPSCRHLFPEEGEHNIIFIFKKEELISMKMMFNGISNLITIVFGTDFSNYNIVNMKGIFSNCKNLKNVEFQSMPSIIKDFSFMFDNCKSITDINLNNYNTKNAIDMSYMLAGCSSLKSIQINSFDTSNVKDMSGLFYECTSLTSIDLNKLNTKNVQSIFYMFAGCTSLQSVNINSLDTNNVKDMSYMFKDCSKLPNIDISNLNTQNLTNINGLFMGCSSLSDVKVDINKFDVKKMNYTDKIFDGCDKLDKKVINSITKSNDEKNPSSSNINSSKNENDDRKDNEKKKKKKKEK